MHKASPSISVVVPVLNESELLPGLLRRLSEMSGLLEIIVVDGGSVDATRDIAMQFGAKVVRANRASRPVQQNLGASHAQGDILWFIHADTLPPVTADKALIAALNTYTEFGCFRFRFDSKRPLMKFNSFCTRFPFMVFRGGDQTLFIKKGLFDRLGGFGERYVVMEEYDLIRRARRLARFSIVPENVIVSTRKYAHNSYLQVNFANLVVFGLFYLGVAPAKLRGIYHRMIQHPMDANRNAAIETSRRVK